MTKARLLILLVLCAVWPATAHAQWDLSDWAQPGSGPGPFTSLFTGYEVRVWCLPTGAGVMDRGTQKIWNCLFDDPDRTRAVLSFGQMWSSAESRQLFIDDPADVGEVKQRRVTVALTYRANTLLSVGGEIDAIQFTNGDRATPFSFWKFGIGPRIVFTPCGKCASEKASDVEHSLARLIHLQLDATWVPQGVKASDFNNFVSKYNPGQEFMVRTTLAIDLAFALRYFHQQ
jgi:hypothetical protein